MLFMHSSNPVLYQCVACSNILKENKDNETLKYSDMEDFDSSVDEYDFF